VPDVNRPPRRIPDATVARLPVYHRCLLELREAGAATVSSEALAEQSGVTASKVRKDLSYLGTYGTRGVGYDVENLVRQIGRELGLTGNWPIVIVGIGNLGRALAAYGGFTARGFRIVGLLDDDPAKHGSRVGDHLVRPTSALAEVVAGDTSVIGVIAVPAAAAQDVADAMVRAGITSILSFSPTVLAAPPGVAVRVVDLASELQILTFHQHQRTEPAA
jgi:redox-sensing transcriptional repressor